jgi:aspartyl-tRNA(Asn)/glutamyl-tRNA(Gln) amidotransferase subunit C
MKISSEDVLRVARLAHLDLSPGEVETYRGQLDEILAYIGKLEQLDVSNVEPMSQVLPHAAGEFADREAQKDAELRADVVRPCNFARAVLDQAPDAAPPFFRVPKVIER